MTMRTGALLLLLSYSLLAMVNSQEILLEFPRDYDEYRPPSSSPYLGLFFNVLDVLKVDDETCTVSVFVEVRVRWDDDRIHVNEEVVANRT